jgi:glutamate/tyrosine decarboxylase-like PLP-dependent enzyme
MANLTALAVARKAKLNNRLDNSVVYLSDQTHSSVERALMILGFQPEQIRKLATDEDFRLPVQTLRTSIAADKAADKIPFCVIANAGTTNTGSIDPLMEIAGLCEDMELWFHIDAAYGGAAVLTDEGREVLHGIECADSIVIDPHKWLFQPFEIGCVLIRDRKQMVEAFHVAAGYLQDLDWSQVNFVDYGLQLTRSFRALKLWMSFKIFGIDAFRQAIQHAFTLASLTENLINNAPALQIVTPAQLGMVTFRYAVANLSTQTLNEINLQIFRKLASDGYALVTTTTLRGFVTLRMVTINPRTTEADIHGTIERIIRFGNEASAELGQAID